MEEGKMRSRKRKDGKGFKRWSPGERQLETSLSRPRSKFQMDEEMLVVKY
jgi:hypothetical protein